MYTTHINTHKQIRCWRKDLAEFEGVFFTGELEIAADEYEHATGGT